MKRLLFSLMIAGFSAVSFNAQTTWDFADITTYPVGTIPMDTSYGGLTFKGRDFSVSKSTITFPDNYGGVNRFQFGGNSYSGSTNPAVGDTQVPPSGKGYVTLSVSEDATVKIWGRGGGTRNILISDATYKVLSTTPFASNTDVKVIEYHYVGTATNLVISSGAGDNYIYKIEYTDNTTLGVNDIRSGMKANVFSTGNKIYVTNLESKNTEINVYSTNGQLVKSLKSSANINFDINGQGIFIVNLKSEAGEKSTKVLIK